MSASLNMGFLPSPLLNNNNLQERPSIGDRLRAAGLAGGGGQSVKNSQMWVNKDRSRVMAKVFEVENYGSRNSKSKGLPFD